MDHLCFILWKYPGRTRSSGPEDRLSGGPSGVLRLFLGVLLISALVATLDVAARRDGGDLDAATDHHATVREN